MLPKMQDELKLWETKYKLLNVNYKKEVEIGLSVLKKILEEVLKTKTVKDRTIEYDKEARED